MTRSRSKPPLARLGLLALLITSCFTGCADQKHQAKGLVQSALQHREAQRHSDAVQLLNRAIALDPVLSEAWYLRGLSHAALKHKKESIADLTACVRLKPDWPEAWLALGVAHRSAGELALALKSFSESIRRGTQSPNVWFDRACVYSDLGEVQKSCDDLEVVLRIDPNHVAARILHARAMMATRPQDAVTDLTHVIGLDRENAEAWLLRGLCWQDNSDADRALADLNIACRLNSTDYRGWLERGRVLLKLGRAEDALSDLSKSVQYGPRVPDCHYELGRAYAAVGNDAGAEANFNQALALNPQHSEVLLARAAIAARRGDHAKALADLHQISVSSLPSGESVNSGFPAEDRVSSEHMAIEKSRALHTIGEHEAALELITKTLEARPDQVEALGLRAQILKALNRSEEALTDYSALIALGAGSEAILIERAKLYLRAERIDEALHDVSIALQQDPGVDALLCRAEIYAQQNEFNLAVHDLTSALQRDPQSSVILQRRAALFEELGESEAAYADLEQAAALEPHTEALIRSMVDRLRQRKQIPEAIAVLDKNRAIRAQQFPISLAVLWCELQLEQGNLRDAKTGLLTLTDSEPAMVPAIVLRARIAAAEKQYDVVIESLGQIPEEETTTEICWLRGTAMSRLGQWAEAEAAFTAMLQREPQHLNGLHARAQLYEELRSWKSAISDCDAILKLEPAHPDARRLRGVAQYHLRYFQDAIEDLNSAEVRRIDTASLQWIRSRCFIELDQKFRAREELNRLLQSEPAHGQARLLRAELAEGQGEYDVAVEDLSTVIPHHPGDADLLLRRALLYQRQGLYEAAIDDFSKVLSLQPDSSEAFYRRGLARHQLQQDDKAIEDLHAALEIDEKLADAWYVKGNISAGQGNAAAAMEFYQRAIVLDPHHAAALYNCGNVLFNEAQLEEAVVSWTRAIEVQPNLFRAYNNRAAAHSKLGHFEEAIADYERAVALSPGFARAWDNYAWLLATNPDPAIRDTTRAVFMAKKAVELTGSKDWSCLSTLAAAYAEAGDMDQATKWAKKAKEVAPEDQRNDIEQLVQAYGNRRIIRRGTSTATLDDSARRQ